MVSVAPARRVGRGGGKQGPVAMIVMILVLSSCKPRFGAIRYGGGGNACGDVGAAQRPGHQHGAGHGLPRAPRGPHAVRGPCWRQARCHSPPGAPPPPPPSPICMRLSITEGGEHHFRP